jgi:hypothetical protein
MKRTYLSQDLRRESSSLKCHKWSRNILTLDILKGTR